MTITKGTEFTEIEKGEIIGLRTTGWTFAAIGKRLGRLPTGISKFWRNQNSYRKKKRPEGQKKMCKRTERRIVLEAKKEGTTASAVQATLGVDISAHTVQRVLQKAPFMRYGKRNGAPGSRKTT
uniref:Transposase IS30-like HTH domain-containing protein n=1 Tax=Globisporangium ultimum (strain ATCC 200006 / CBS 805.95 / DAOM BR144) TaxID=431595 RepID=K3W7S3_GLOUD